MRKIRNYGVLVENPEYVLCIFKIQGLSIQLLTIDICQGKTIDSVFILQPKFRGCLQMTFSSFVRIFARLHWHHLKCFKPHVSRSIALTIILKSFNNYFSNIFRVQYMKNLYINIEPACYQSRQIVCLPPRPSRMSSRSARA